MRTNLKDSNVNTDNTHLHPNAGAALHHEAIVNALLPHVIVAKARVATHPLETMNIIKRDLVKANTQSRAGRKALKVIPQHGAPPIPHSQPLLPPPQHHQHLPSPRSETMPPAQHLVMNK